MTENIERVLAFCRDKFPEHKATIIRDDETVIIYLHHEENSWANRDRIVYYNAWYPDEYSVFSLKAED